MKKIVDMKFHYVLYCSFFILWSCSEEVEKLSVEKLDNLVISGIAEEYRIKLNDVLEISPVINEVSNDDDYEYVWYMYAMASLASEVNYDTLGVEKNLSCTIDNRVISAVDSEHCLVFKATNKKTGVYYVHRSKLFASGVYGLGTFLLVRNDGENQLHFIHRDSKAIVEDVYEGDLINPTKVAFVKPINRYLPELKSVMIFCTNEDGGVVLDPNTFTKTMTFREKVNAEESGVLTPTLHFQNGIYDYLIYNGSSCCKKMSSDIYDPVFAVISEPGEAELAPIVWNVLQSYNENYGSYTVEGPLYYDELNNRFLEHAIDLRGYLREMKNSENSVFDCNNLGDNMTFVCGGILPGIGNGWILTKDDVTNKLWLFKFATIVEYPEPNNTLQCVVTFTGTEKIELTSQYAANLGNAKYISSIYAVEDDIFVFTTENGVYSFNVNSASAANPTNVETKLIDISELNGLKITGMEYISYEIEDPDNPYDPLIEKEVRLSVVDDTQVAKNVGVIFYSLKTLGGIHLEESFRALNICDEIIDIEEKFN